MEQVEVIEQLGDTYTIKLLDGTTKMRIPSWSLVLFEINALVTMEIKRNGQIVHCLAKILNIIETGNPQAVVTLQDALLDSDNQPKQIDMLDLRGVQRINGQIVEHDMLPQGTKLEYRDDYDYYDVTIVKVNENEDPTLTTYDVKGSDNQITLNVPRYKLQHDLLLPVEEPVSEPVPELVARGKGKISGGKGLHYTSHNPPQEDANSVVSALSDKDDAAEHDDEPYSDDDGEDDDIVQTKNAKKSYGKCETKEELDVWAVADINNLKPQFSNSDSGKAKANQHIKRIEKDIAFYNTLDGRKGKGIQLKDKLLECNQYLSEKPNTCLKMFTKNLSRLEKLDHKELSFPACNTPMDFKTGINDIADRADRLNETIFDVEAKVNKYKKTLERDGRDPDIEQLLLDRERNLEGLKDRRQRFRLELAYVADSFAALKAIHLGIPKEVEWKEQQKTILKTRLSDIEDFIERNKDRLTEIQETKQAALAKKRKSDGNAATHKSRKQIRLDRAPR